MPELPEVETVRRGLLPVLCGRRIIKAQTARADLRVPFPPGFAQNLSGARILNLRRRAKYLLADLDRGNTLIIHLGMSGTLRLEGGAPGEAGVMPALAHETQKLPQHDHVRLQIEGIGDLVFNDPRRFGLMALAETATLEAHALFLHLGLEPLEETFDGDALAKCLAGRRAPLKASLLDQRLVVGVGNIYACEALHRARLSPIRMSGALSRARIDALAGAIKSVLTDAIAAGGSSLKDYVRADGSLGYFQHTFAVYDRAGDSCHTPGCTGTVKRIVQSNRSTFYCPRCQR